MKRLEGIGAPNLLLQIEQEVGTLMFAEFPTTIVFSDKEGNPIIKEWVDCSDDSAEDRYFYFKTSKQLLKQFIAAKIPHLELVLRAIDSFLYFQDVSVNGRTGNNVVVSSNELIPEYRPNPNFYFKTSDGVDVTEIYNFFNLSELAIEDVVLAAIPKIATETRSEIINIHLKEGEGVGYGRVNTNILGKALSNFDNLYREIAHDHFDGKNRVGKKLSDKEKELRELSISTEVLPYLKAASFSVFIKPVAMQQNLFEGTTNSEIIVSKVFALFEASKDKNTLLQMYDEQSDNTFKRYKELLDEIKEFDMKVDYNWYSPFNSRVFKIEFNLSQAQTIIDNLKSLEKITPEDPFKVKGQFKELHLQTGHFVFVSNKEETFSGYFSKQIIGSMPRLSWTTLYEITIHRKTIKEAGQVEPKIKDTVVSCLPLSNT